LSPVPARPRGGPVGETPFAVTEPRFSVVDVRGVMTRGSEFLLSLLLGVPAAAIGLLLLSLGPLGWFLAAFLGVAVVGAAAVFGDAAPDVGSGYCNCVPVARRPVPASDRY
jgi:hypothetical protein